jgi:hypothetical protein
MRVEKTIGKNLIAKLTVDNCDQFGLLAFFWCLAKHSMWASLPGCSRMDGRWALVIGFLQITQMASL